MLGTMDAAGRAEVIQRVYRWEMTSERGRDEWESLDEDMAERARRRPRA